MVLVVMVIVPELSMPPTPVANVPLPAMVLLVMVIVPKLQMPTLID
jgi:hypothetical protein